MKHVQGRVSDEAKDVLIDYQKINGFNHQDEALEDLLLKFNKRLTEAQIAVFMRHGAEATIAAFIADRMIPENLDSRAVVAEVLRRRKDPRSDPLSIPMMIS